MDKADYFYLISISTYATILDLIFDLRVVAGFAPGPFHLIWLRVQKAVPKFQREFLDFGRQYAHMSFLFHFLH